jgi:hypothetical protein
MRQFGFVMIACLLATTVDGGEKGKTDSPGLTKEEIKDGFKPIFNGKSLDGWKGKPETVEGHAAENGMLVCTKKAKGILYTDKDYGDFILRFDFNLQPGGNNGINVRGHEIQILDDYADIHKNIKPCQYHGSIYCKVAAKRGHTKKAGEWNTQEIKVKGTQWTVTVNGVVIVDEDIAKVKGLEDVAKRTKGPLGLMSHGTRVEFRNLRIKDL